MDACQYNISELPERLRSNVENHLIYTDGQGKEVKKPFSAVLEDALRVAAALPRYVAVSSTSRILVCGEPSYHWVQFALAVICSGAELVALPESMSHEEINASIEGLEITGAFVPDALLDKGIFRSIPTYSVRLVLDDLGTEMLPADALTMASTQNLIAFTSGSTASSKLKAFHVPLASSLAFTDRFRRLFDIDKTDTWLICHSFSHIVHFEYLLGGLYWGYNVVIANVFQVLMKGMRYRPSVLVSVPMVYEKLAGQIKSRFHSDAEGQLKLAEIEQRPIEHTDGTVIRYPLCDEAKAVLGDRLKMMLIGASPSTKELQSFLLQVGLPMYEGYGMSEANMISCNIPTTSIMGSVGPAWPGIELKLDEHEELLVRTTPTRACRYLNVDNETNAQTFLPDGWIATGDLAAIDNGILKIFGRKKEIIISAGGKNINPVPLEMKLKALGNVQHAVVYGDRRPFLVGIVALQEPSEVEQEVRRIRDAVDTLNRELPVHERILDIIVAETPFHEEDGTLTRSGKPRKGQIIHRYKDRLEEIYG